MTETRKGVGDAIAALRSVNSSMSPGLARRLAEKGRRSYRGRPPRSDRQRVFDAALQFARRPRAHYKAASGDSESRTGAQITTLATDYTTYDAVLAPLLESIGREATE